MADARGPVMELVETMGLEGFSFDANGMACIRFDDLVVNIHADDQADEITLFMTIGDIPAAPAAKAAAYAYMLKNNNFSRNTGGGVLGVDEAEKAAYFSHRFAAGTLTATRLEGILEAFLNLADSFVAGFREASHADGGDPLPVSAGIRV